MIYSYTILFVGLLRCLRVSSLRHNPNFGSWFDKVDQITFLMSNKAVALSLTFAMEASVTPTQWMSQSQMGLRISHVHGILVLVITRFRSINIKIQVITAIL